MSYQPEVDQRMVTAVIRIVDRYTALEPIGRGELVRAVELAGFSTNERAVREAVKQARRLGQLICSTPGNNGGYYMARDMDELMAFGRAEFLAKISDMSETWSIMLRAGKHEFGTVQQGELF